MEVSAFLQPIPFYWELINFRDYWCNCEYGSHLYPKLWMGRSGRLCIYFSDNLWTGFHQFNTSFVSLSRYHRKIQWDPTPSVLQGWVSAPHEWPFPPQSSGNQCTNPQTPHLLPGIGKPCWLSKCTNRGRTGVVSRSRSREGTVAQPLVNTGLMVGPKWGLLGTFFFFFSSLCSSGQLCEYSNSWLKGRGEPTVGDLSPPH